MPNFSFDTIALISQEAGRLKAAPGFAQAQQVVNAILALFGVAAADTWEITTDSRGKIRGNAGFFMSAEGFGDRKAVYKVAAANNKQIDFKAFWMKKPGRQVINWVVAAIWPNFEDEPGIFSRNNIGIDFVIPEKADRVMVVLSKGYTIRTLEIFGELSPTQQEIFAKWQTTFDFANKAQVHELLWQSFDIEPLNKRFYKEISSYFTELKTHLTTNAIFDERHAAHFVNRLIGRIVFCWFLEKKGIINAEVAYFDATGQTGTEYYRSKLETLFFRVLNTPVEDRTPGIDRSTPFLNGGLFEAKPGDLYSSAALTFPADYFIRLFQRLRHYNFTTDESTSAFQQVAIDPEMLGRIFENLLAEQREETGEQARKAKGAFYTPREIVDYMCRESLRHYLQSHFAGNADAHTRINDLIDKKEHDWRDQQKNYRDNLKDYKYELLRALDNLKIVDPACGSGAFPMGMLALLVEVYERLDHRFDPYKQKLAIIKNTIYGVDIEPMAVEISRLRAWLSIVINETKIDPLPNLDFKFVCANSLLPLDDNKQTQMEDSADELAKEMQSIRDEYYETKSKKKKELLKKRFEDLLSKRKQASLFGKSKKREQLESYHPFDEEQVVQFFDPEFMFGVSGFDIVIGNPPYVQLQKFARTQTQKDLETAGYHTFAKTGDLYCLFYERGMEIVKQQTGLLCYITSNKWMRAGYGERLRAFFASKNPVQLIDFGGFKVFESATVDTNILLITNGHNQHQLQACHFQNDYQRGSELGDYFKKNQIQLPHLSAGSWFIGGATQLALKDKIERTGTPLKEWDVQINYGIKTSLNEAFIIDQAKRDELVAADPRSAEIIKPILRGRDIQRYGHAWAKLWVIGTFKQHRHSFSLDSYPAVKAHLLPFRPDLEPKPNNWDEKSQGKWPGRNTQPFDYLWHEVFFAPSLGEFEKEKMIWTDIATRPTFALAPAGLYLNNTAYMISGDHLRYLTAVLNASITAWYFPLIATDLGENGNRFIKQFVELIPIPLITPANAAVVIQLESLVDEITAITATPGYSVQQPPARQRELEARIDDLVFDLYELTPEERNIVLNS